MGYRDNVIKSDDPQAIEKLTQKLEDCQKNQQDMKDKNAYFRKFGTMAGYPGISEAEAKRLDVKVENAYSWNKQPYASYELQNNNQEINRLKKRIAELTKDKEVGFVGWEFNGGEAVANKEDNRLQLFFDEKPSAEQRNELKRYGFRWAPSVNAWQRQLNHNAISAASYIDFLKTKDGQKPYQIQPKAPVKEDMSR